MASERPDTALSGPLTWVAVLCALCTTLGVLSVAVLAPVLSDNRRLLPPLERVVDSLEDASLSGWVAIVLGSWLTLTVVAIACSALFLLFLRVAPAFRRLPSLPQGALTVFGLQSLVGVLVLLAPLVLSGR